MPLTTFTAHMMLGNTYPFTKDDWHRTLSMGEQVGLDAFALNLGPNDWQTSQARSAYSEASEASHQIKLFLQLDMDVLPSANSSDMYRLVDLVIEFAGKPCQLKTTLPHIHHNGTQDGNGNEKVVLSTFSGHWASFGGSGWEGFLKACGDRGVDVFFIPAFFLPPEEILSKDYVDGALNWNSSWSLDGRASNIDEDPPFLIHPKPYMAAISPGFFTHYGATGEWAFNKNFIFGSDDNAFATRWQQVLSFRPEFIQILTWNDYGESNYIGPIMGAQPGSNAWTDGMDHSDCWMGMTKYFIEKYKIDSVLSDDSISYRTSSKELNIESDPIGKPSKWERANDVISIFVTYPNNANEFQTRSFRMLIRSGEKSQNIGLVPQNGIQMFTVAFGDGPVAFEVLNEGDRIDQWEGRPISRPLTYNFNAWTMKRRIKVI